MASNIYYPVYKNIENEFNNLMFNIHIDDNQLNVYSSKISELILRASTEIESLSKELYKLNGGAKTLNIKYDEDAINHLNSLWNLDKKVVLISSYNCFQTNKEIIPFEKNELRSGTKRPTFSWNNAYQNLKHDRANSISFGSIKYLFDVTAALFLMNVYYNDLSFNLERDNSGLNFNSDLGSSIFSVKLHINYAIPLVDDYVKSPNFDQCVYLLKMTNKSLVEVRRVFNIINKSVFELDFKQRLNAMKPDGNVNQLIDIKELRKQQTRSIARENSHTFENIKYEAILNKNQY